MSQENVAVARKAINALNRGDYDALLAFASPDVVWEALEGVPGIGELYRGAGGGARVDRADVGNRGGGRPHRDRADNGLPRSCSPSVAVTTAVMTVKKAIPLSMTTVPIRRTGRPKHRAKPNAVLSGGGDSRPARERPASAIAPRRPRCATGGGPRDQAVARRDEFARARRQPRVQAPPNRQRRA